MQYAFLALSAASGYGCFWRIKRKGECREVDGVIVALTPSGDCSTATIEYREATGTTKRFDGPSSLPPIGNVGEKVAVLVRPDGTAWTRRGTHTEIVILGVVAAFALVVAVNFHVGVMK